MKATLFALALFVLFDGAFAIANYGECLNCFYQNRNNFYFCQSNSQCLSVRNRTCPLASMIQREDLCVEGFQQCTNVTFSEVSVGQIFEYGYGLPPGHGCYIQIDRFRNGSYGTMHIDFDSSSILVFDN